jgi:hypothetical protein
MTAPRPGDPFHLYPGGTVNAGRYIEVDPPHRLVIEWQREGTDNATPTPALIEFTFTPTGDETSVEVQLSGPVRRMLSSIRNSLRVTSTGAKLPFLAPNPAHFLATESGTTSDATYGYARSTPCDGPATESS